ncbi:sensor histidine kinase [Amnibacterium flavum]|uniref:histidine kinase n=1 Tax=Amnibacterium flavum TaxID=2173173 RepID=A0A2V1HV22_9MICO|nr:histidine kinase [Amnibacterium flavum]PVZ94157.1 ATP-binding protein [Amnibacterium flavum]
MVDLVTVGLIALPVVTAAAVVFLVLWILSVRRYRRLASEQGLEDRDRLELELSVAEQGGRLRIIRELHDLNLHRVSMLVTDAEGARYAGERNPQAAVRAANGIAETARAMLADMRRVSSLVRETEAGVLPQPTLKSTRDLFKVMRDAGLGVTFEESGVPYDLNPGAELAVYRILQEALTNALKYGGEGTEARVLLTWTAQGLQVRVDDDGIRNAAARRGLDVEVATAYTVDEDLRSLTQQIMGPGIDEMRERTELFGGAFNASQTAGVGFSVAAVFPALKHHNGVHGVDLSHDGHR